MIADRANGATVGRKRLAAALRACAPLLTPECVADTLGMERGAASKILARWVRQGWLVRVQRGVYAPVPLDAPGASQVLSNPWVLVPQLFAPGYVGGWSAAEHWDLTEQIFRSVCVLTSRPVKAKEQTLQGARFVLKHVREGAMFGTRVVWEGRVRIPVSDPHKTIVDMLDDPSLGGGIRHVTDCVARYLGRADADPAAVVRYAEKLGNGAVFKRLGYLLNRLDGPTAAIDACAGRLTSGLAKLDTALPCPRLVTRWRLWVPEGWEASRD